MGIDPGFSKTGYCAVLVTPTGKRDEEVLVPKLLAVGVIKTKKANKKAQISTERDLLHRIEVIRSGLAAATYRKPARKGESELSSPRVLILANCAYVASEEMKFIGTSGKVAWRGLGIFWGVLVTLLSQHRKSLLTFKVETLKRIATGEVKPPRRRTRKRVFATDEEKEAFEKAEQKRKAQVRKKSKEAVIEGIRNTPGFENFDALLKRGGFGTGAGVLEHAADACAAALASLETVDARVAGGLKP